MRRWLQYYWWTPQAMDASNTKHWPNLNMSFFLLAQNMAREIQAGQHIAKSKKTRSLNVSQITWAHHPNHPLPTFPLCISISPTPTHRSSMTWVEVKKCSPPQFPTVIRPNASETRPFSHFHNARGGHRQAVLNPGMDGRRKTHVES